jgi:hypothetical protein
MSGLREIQIRGLEGTDLALVDPNLGLPTFVSGVRGSEVLGGWLVPGQLPVYSHHASNGVNHVVIAAEFLFTGRVAILSNWSQSWFGASPADPTLGTSVFATRSLNGWLGSHDGHAMISDIASRSISLAVTNTRAVIPTVSHNPHASVRGNHSPDRDVGTIATYKGHKPG